MILIVLAAMLHYSFPGRFTLLSPFPDRSQYPPDQHHLG